MGGLGSLLWGISGILIAVGALYVFAKFVIILNKLERKLDKDS